MAVATKNVTPVGLTAEQLQSLLDALDASVREPDIQRRKSRRLPFRSLNVLLEVLDKQGHVLGRARVATRDISASGLAFLRKSAMTPGQLVRFEIPVLDGRVLRVPAQIIRCRHLQRTIHEIGARFIGLAERL